MPRLIMPPIELSRLEVNAKGHKGTSKGHSHLFKSNTTDKLNKCSHSGWESETDQTTSVALHWVAKSVSTFSTLVQLPRRALGLLLNPVTCYKHYKYFRLF